MLTATANPLTMASVEQRIPPWYISTIGISNGLHGVYILINNTPKDAFLPFGYAGKTRTSAQSYKMQLLTRETLSEFNPSTFCLVYIVHY
jgi:hypothetical protein